MKINKATVDLVKRFEGRELDAYLDPVGIVTIGYGYTNRAGFGPGVKMGDKWTVKQANDILVEGLERFGDSILPAMTRKPTENQFGAMLSLAYNVGIDGFKRSTVLRKFNAGDDDGAAAAFAMWNKAGGKVLRGLVRRRAAEAELYLSDSPDERAVPDRQRSNPAQSTTNIAAVTGTVASAASMSDDAREIVGNVTQTFGIDPKWIFVAIVIAAFGWIFRERMKKWFAGWR